MRGEVAEARLDDAQADRRAVRAADDRARVVDQAATGGVERGARAGIAGQVGRERGAALGGPGRDVRAQRSGLDLRDGQADVTAIRATGPALHLVAMARLDAREERVDLGRQLVISHSQPYHRDAMDLNDIVVFTKVVETRSFTAAAEQLGLPKSTVSRKLAQLEERLGVRLVQRTTRKLAITEIGEAYYARCARIVADVSAAEQVVTDMQATPRGRLRISAPVDLSTRYLGSIIADFVARHADVNVELDASDHNVDLIEEGFDLAVRIGPMPESSLIARRLCSLHSVLCASAGYLAKHGTPTAIEQLDDHERVIFIPNPRTQAWTLVHGDATYEFGRPARLASNNYGAVHDAAVAGAGIALLSDFMVGCDLHNGVLVPVLPEWTTRAFDVHAIYPARTNVPPRLSLFLDHLSRALNPPPWTRGEPKNAASSAP